jgi:hypothetical protein
LESSQAFLGARPEWTCSGALLKDEDGSAARIEQTQFLWFEGAWEAHITIHPIEPLEGMNTVSMKVRITPDTLRRWSTVGINPFLEACAQLQEFWRVSGRGNIDTLTYL